MQSRIKLLSDLHGDWLYLDHICKKFPDHTIIQLGDLGTGFGHDPEKLPDNLIYIFGNHSDRYHDRTYPQYLGDFGILDINGLKAFYIGGAKSIDRQYRTPNVDWWEHEELNSHEFSEAEKLYEFHKPQIVLSHDAPHFLYYDILTNACKIRVSPNEDTRSRTNLFLEHLFQTHQPQKHYFGHFHSPYKRIVDGTTFRCLNINEVCDL